MLRLSLITLVSAACSGPSPTAPPSSAPSPVAAPVAAPAAAPAAAPVAAPAAAPAAPSLPQPPAGTEPVTLPAGARTGCAIAGYRAPAGAQLVLHAQQAPTGRATVHAGIHNAGTDAVCIYSHIATHEIQNDWLTVQYADGARYHHFDRVIELDDSRDKSAAVSVLLEPGKTVWYTIDVDAWAARDRNGREPLPAGSLSAQVAYDTSGDGNVWAGKLHSARFELRTR